MPMRRALTVLVLLLVWANTLAQQVLGVRSPGRDGIFSDTDYSIIGFEQDDFDQDIVWADGFFVRWPERKDR